MTNLYEQRKKELNRLYKEKKDILSKIKKLRLYIHLFEHRAKRKKESKEN